MASSAPELVPFSPQWTQQLPGGSKILDENLAKIKAAIDRANATIIRQQTLISQLISTVNVTITTPARPSQPVPSLDSAQDEAGDTSTLVPGPRGLPGFGMPGMPGGDGDDADVMLVPGPPGRRGEPGTLSPPPDTDEDAPEAPPLLIIPPRDPFVLALGYGPDDLDGTLPMFGGGGGLPCFFWLHPFTSLDNASPVATGGSDDHAIIEWEAGGSYTRAQLDIFVRSSSLSGSPGPGVLTVVITKNGSDTAVGTTIAASETDQRHNTSGTLSIADGDTVGVKIKENADFTGGFLIAHFILRLT